MAWDPAFLELMPITVTVEEVASRNAYGAPTYSTATSHRARIREKMERVFDVDGRENWAKSKVWLAPDDDGNLPELKTGSRVTLPDGTQPPILAVERVHDEDGVHHVVFWFGDTARVQ